MLEVLSPYLEVVLDFILVHKIELIGAIIALIYLRLQYQINMWFWPVGIILPLFYIYISLEAKFYGNILINGYFVLASIWGWYLWYKNRNKDTGENEEPITSISLKNNLMSWLIALPLYGLLYYVTANYTDSIVPWADALSTTISFVGMVWLANKWQENWLCWIIADLISSYLYYTSEHYTSAVVFTIYFIVAVMGYFHWKSLAEKQANEAIS